jgi:hypothetical protein
MTHARNLRVNRHILLDLNGGMIGQGMIAGSVRSDNRAAAAGGGLINSRLKIAAGGARRRAGICFVAAPRRCAGASPASRRLASARPALAPKCTCYSCADPKS